MFVSWQMRKHSFKINTELLEADRLCLWDSDVDEIQNEFLSFNTKFVLLISSFRRVQNIVCFLLGNSPASDLYMPTFRNTLSVPFS